MAFPLWKGIPRNAHKKKGAARETKRITKEKSKCPCSSDSVTNLGVSKTDYSQIADYYDKVRPPPANVWIWKIIEYGEINENSSVLDVGCGTGRFPLSVSSLKNALICALEPSINMLKKAVAKDESRKILWVQGDGQKLPFRGDFFDCVYMTLVIHHIEDKELALQEIYRTLKEGGNCVIMTISHYRMKRGILRYFPGVVAIDLQRVPTIPCLIGMMIKAGFRNVHHHMVKHDEGPLSTEEYFERVRKRYISTLTLLSQEEFERGIKIFERKVREKYGKQIERTLGFDFVVGKK